MKKICIYNLQNISFMCGVFAVLVLQDILQFYLNITITIY